MYVLNVLLFMSVFGSVCTHTFCTFNFMMTVLNGTRFVFLGTKTYVIMPSIERFRIFIICVWSSNSPGEYIWPREQNRNRNESCITMSNKRYGHVL